MLHAHKEAIRHRSRDVTPEHLFLGIIKTDDKTRKILPELGINVDELLSIVSKALSAQADNQAHKNLELSKSSAKIMKITHFEAKILKERTIEPYHILLSILRDTTNLVYKEFDKRSLIDQIKNEIKHRVESGKLPSRIVLLEKWFRWLQELLQKTKHKNVHTK